MLPRVALECGQPWWAASVSRRAVSGSTPGTVTRMGDGQAVAAAGDGAQRHARLDRRRAGVHLGAATDDAQRALEAGRVAGRGQWRAALRRRGWRPKRAADGGVRARVHRRLGEFDLQRAAVRGRARLVLWDQRGHGRSGWGDPRYATIEQTGRDLGCVPGSRSSRPPQMITGFGRHGCGAWSSPPSRSSWCGPAGTFPTADGAKPERLASAPGTNWATAEGAVDASPGRSVSLSRTWASSA